ncbi:MAG: cytochrome c-type biogenesis protein [Pseudomonadota bacterium]|nr:cytochrome c-type biogenesis protein [Pseudomonadota bacterium]
MKLFPAVLAGLAFATAAFAVEPDEMLADAALEARAEALDRELRCVVCQSQSIAESNADLAKEMRVVVRERLAAGDSDEEILAYLVERYGDYVLLRPPVQGNTIFLWVFPALVLLAGLTGGVFYVRRLRPAAPAALSEEEAAALKDLLEEREAE